jgi:hypothetical protein
MTDPKRTSTLIFPDIPSSLCLTATVEPLQLNMLGATFAEFYLGSQSLFSTPNLCRSVKKRKNC